jgi:hypothetical protein
LNIFFCLPLHTKLNCVSIVSYDFVFPEIVSIIIIFLFRLLFFNSFRFFLFFLVLLWIRKALDVKSCYQTFYCAVNILRIKVSILNVFAGEGVMFMSFTTTKSYRTRSLSWKICSHASVIPNVFFF